MDQDKKTLFIFYIISVVVHGLLIGGFVFLKDFHLPKSKPQVIQIDLVSFAPMAGTDKPGGGGGGGGEVKEKKEEKKQSSQEIKESSAPAALPEPKRVEPPPVIKPDISLKEKPKNLKELQAEQEKKTKEEEKKKEEKTEKTQQKEPEKTKTAEKQNDKQQEGNLSDALNRLRKKVAEQGSLSQGKGGEGKGSGGKGAEGDSGEGQGFKGVPGGTGKGGASAEQQLIFNIVSRIQENWVFNDSLAKMDKNLEVTILIKILKNGEIRDIIFETRSGNAYLDESAKKAIMKVNPLPPLPAGMYSYDLGLIFTPQGLK